MASKEGKYLILLKFKNLIAVIALLIGFAIYIFLRSSDFLFMRWAHHLGIRNFLYSLRLKISEDQMIIPSWFIYSLPDGLWAFAYTFLIINLWSGCKNFWRYFWFASIPLITIGHEVLQMHGFIEGTFSIGDIVFEAVGIGSAIIVKHLINNYTSYHEKLC